MTTPNSAGTYDILSVLRRALAYLRPYHGRFGAGVLLTAAGIGLDLVKPLPLALVLDVVLGESKLPHGLQPVLGGFSNVALLSIAAAAIVVVTFLRGACTVAANYLTIYTGQQMVNDLRTGFWAHLQKLSLKFHHQQQTGDLLFRVMADTFSAQGMVMNGFLPLCSAAVMLVGMFAVMARYDWQLSLIALIVCPPLYIAINRMGSHIHRHASASREAESALYARAESTIGAVKLMQAYGREERSVAEFREGSARSLALSLRLYSAETVFGLIVDSVLSLGTAALVWVGAMHVLQGNLKIGDLTIFLSYLKDLYGPIQNISANLAEISSSRAGLERVFSVLDIEPDIKDKPGAADIEAARGAVRFENVTFAYDDGRPVLRGVDLDIRPGERIALVGRTGAGKSTLASLLLRFFDPQEGRVTVDGHDLRDVTLRSLRSQLTLMLQEPILFHTTVTENIAFGAPVGEAVVRDAARRAAAEDFILKLPQGYETVLGEDGVTLSGGQRQRLALARALLRETPIVILDEPTSSLDVRTEGEVWRNVEDLLVGRTAIVIAHRLSTARRADRVVVLEGGVLVEQGTHDELVRRGGVYADMWARSGAGGDERRLAAVGA
jgi:ATP-binding cassette subfamily B protein/subfamily B ATP-binding cassette protein MsbA